MCPSESPLTVVVTARALIARDDQLLLVSDAGTYWYTPGGHLHPGEDLLTCLRREVHEETGLTVTDATLLHVAEFIEMETAQHKIECYYRANIENPSLPHQWSDSGTVPMRRYFAICVMKHEIDVRPMFLREGTWQSDAPPSQIYQRTE